MSVGVAIEIYENFPEDFLHRLTPKAQEEVKVLLARLQVNPYEPQLQRECALHDGELFEYPLDGKLSIFWRVQDSNLSVTNPRMTIWLDKIARSSGRKG
jgi:hypothetical protein